MALGKQSDQSKLDRLGFAPDDMLDYNMKLGDLCRRVEVQGKLFTLNLRFADYPISHRKARATPAAAKYILTD